MTLERSLEKINTVRKRYLNVFLRSSKLYTGIRTLDKALSGFESDTIYTIIAREGNGIYSFVNTIAGNIEVLYQTNFSLISDKNKDQDDFWQFINENKLYLMVNDDLDLITDNPYMCHIPVLIIANINVFGTMELNEIKKKTRKIKHREVVFMFIYILQDHKEGKIKLADIPKEVLENSDVIISLYRPEYYHIENWEDNTSTKDQVEFCIIKNITNKLTSGRLVLDKKIRRVRSIQVKQFENFYRNLHNFLENK